MAAAFISMGTASADTGTPEPFTDLLRDLLGANATPAELANAAAADTTFATAAQDPSLAAAFDQLDGFFANPPGDEDPFEDLLSATRPLCKSPKPWRVTPS